MTSNGKQRGLRRTMTASTKYVIKENQISENEWK